MNTPIHQDKRDKRIAELPFKPILTLLTALLLGCLSGTSPAAEPPAKAQVAGPAGKPYIYKTSAGKERRMEIFFPPNHDPAKSKVPGMILFHGGAWLGGGLDEFRNTCAYFASRGLVCATAEYQMLKMSKAEAAKLPAGESHKRVCVIDAKSAIRWFKQHAGELGVDPARIITGGTSAGGHISALATMNPGLNDPADAKDIDTRAVAYIWVNPAFAGQDSKTPAIDVERHLKADLPPAIVFFGDMDGYKKSWDDGPYAKWKALGTKTIDYLIAPGEGHGFWNYSTQWQTTMLIATDRFLVKHGLLTGEPTLQAPATGEKFVPAADASTSKKVYYPQMSPAKESAMACFRDWPEGKEPAEVGKRVAENFLPRRHYQDHELLRYPDFPAIIGGYKKMMAALLQHQAPSGLWRQLVDKPETWEETSGSGMFAYAMVTGVRRDWLDPEIYGPAARKAWLALVGQIDAGGNLQ